MKKLKMTTLATAGLAGLAVPFVLGGTAVGQQQTVTTCPAGVTPPSQYCTVTTVQTPPPTTTTGTTTTAPSTNPPQGGSADSQSGKPLKSNLTVKRKPARDRKAPFKYKLTGTVNGGPKTVDCSGNIAFVVKRGKKAVQTKTVKVAKNCKFSVSLRYTAKKLKVKRGTLSVEVQWKGNKALAKSTHKLKLRFG